MSQHPPGHPQLSFARQLSFTSQLSFTRQGDRATVPTLLTAARGAHSGERRAPPAHLQPC